jgi:glycerol-3-phosphate dehydrogenase (NAD(P)+)
MLLARNGHRVFMWARDPEHVQAMADAGENTRYLPELAFPPGLSVSADLEQCVAQADAVLLVCPSHAFAEVLDKVAAVRPKDQPLFWATKGFEHGSGRFLHELVEERIDTPARGVVTGPSFALEVAQGKPTACTVASFDPKAGEWFAGLLHGNSFRAYHSSDVVGAEIGGAVKNVLAVATGIADGMELGHNTRAALITRGSAESTRLGLAMGAKPETFMGLAGIGDLVLTCTGDLSRNRRFGLALGRGIQADQAVRDIGQVVEGIHTATEVRRLAQEHGVEMPIAEVTWAIIHQGKSPQDGLQELLSRQPRPEGV